VAPVHDLAAAFQADGAVVARGLLGPSDIASATRGIERVLAEPGPLFKRASALHDGAFVEDFCTWSRVEEIGQLARLPAVTAFAAHLMGASRVRFKRYS